MALQLPHRTLLRRAATTAALGAAMLAPLASPAAAAKKAKRSKHPVVTSVAPMQLTVGDTLEVRGRNFLPGKERNTVVFQRAGGKAVFVKARLSTRKLLKVDLPEKLHKALAQSDGALVPTRLNLRVLSARFGKRFTRDAGSPTVAPKPAPPAPVSVLPPAPPAPPAPVATPSPMPEPPAPTPEPSPEPSPEPVDPKGPEGDCDSDKLLNGAESDDDGDLLPDLVEDRINKRLDESHVSGGRIDRCAADSDGDGIPDGYEYHSARDLNDDEYQDPNAYLPAPEKRMYPNPLDGGDLNKDFDGDGLSLGQEYRLYRFQLSNDKVDVAKLTLDTPLSYSDGLQYSVYERDARGVRRPALAAAGYDKAEEFFAWVEDNGYDRVYLPTWNDEFDLPAGELPYHLFDIDRDGELRTENHEDYLSTESLNFDDGDGWLSDDERDEDADGLHNMEETNGRMHAEWWAKRYPAEVPFEIKYAGTDLADGDTDGDGVRDGADDQDFDDVPNLMELSRNMATGLPGRDPETGRLFDKEDISAEDLKKERALNGPRPSHGRVNPFNPCLPHKLARTCPRYVPFDGAWAPYDKSLNYVIFN